MSAAPEVTKPAREVKAGDLLNLEGDPYADPKRDNALFECEYVEVAFVEQETPECVLMGIEGFDWVGFPTEHPLKVRVPL